MAFKPTQKIAIFIFLQLIFPLLTVTVPDANASGADIIAKTKDLMSVVERLRGLQFINDLPVELVDFDGIKEIITRELDEQITEELDSNYSEMYALLGLLPENSSLRDMYQSMIEEQAAGLYDPGDKKFYVVDIDIGSAIGNMLGFEGAFGDFASGFLEGFLGGMGLDMQSTIIVHELTHALDDQHFDIEATMEYLLTAESDDMQLAYQSLLEGSATKTMNDYVFSKMGVDTSVAQNLAGNADANIALTEGMMDYPALLKRIMVAPYLKGEEFVRYLHKEGGHEAVDNAFRNPPTSMEQIYNPADFIRSRDIPSVIEDPDMQSALPGWKKQASNTLGILLIGLMFEMSMNDKDYGDKIASGWDGDRITIWKSPHGDMAFAWCTTWDSADDAMEFYDAYLDFLDARFPSGTWATNWNGQAVYLFTGTASGIEIDGRDVVIVERVPENRVNACIEELWKTPIVYK